MSKLRDKTGKFTKGNEGYWKGKKRISMTGEKNWRYTGRFEKTCTQCSKTFQVEKYRISTAKFCSASCRARFTHSGEKNTNWKGGISTYKDKLKATPEYAEWRLKVFRRDWFTCKMCGHRSKKSKAHGDKTSDIQAHHIIPIRDNEDLIHEVSNGITLCINCHRETYNKEYGFVKVFKKILNDYTPNIPKG